MQTVEVKAMAQNAGVYMRSVRSRHLRSVLKEPVNQKAPLCHNERRVIDDVVWSFRLSCSNRRRLLIYFTFVFHLSFFSRTKFLPIRWDLKHAVSLAVCVKWVSAGPCMKTDFQALAVTYQKCFLICVLYLFRNSKKNTPDYNHRNWHILLLLNPY